jgi:magnesium chelatase subunit I
LVDEYNPNLEEQDRLFFMELVIWSLSINNKLDKTESEKAFSFDSARFNKQYFGNN